MFIHPRLSFRERHANLYIAYSIGVLFLKYYLNKSYQEIKEFTNNQHDYGNQVINEFLINSFNISQNIAIEYINNLDALCEHLEEKGANLNILNIPNKAQNDKFNNDNENEQSFNIRDVNYDNMILPVNDQQRICQVNDAAPIAQVQDPNIGCCPHCKSNYIFEGGCKFITCESAFCNKKKFFCHLCKKSLKLTEKTSHFPNGIYGNSCLNC